MIKQREHQIYPYYLGLEITPTGVGYSVTDEDYNIIRFRNKYMHGIRLFDPAETAEERRLHRTSRRLIRRRTERIKLLQDIFSEEISKIDNSFFVRLNESFMKDEDKTTGKYSLFNDKDYTDKDFYKDYPTIFHVRKALIEGADVDVRILYLALHHIIKSRGHFLLAGDLSSVSDFDNVFQSFVEVMESTLSIKVICENVEELKNLLQDSKERKSDKAKKMESLIDVEAITEDDEIVELDPKRRKVIITHICKFLTGNKGDIEKLIGESVDDIYKSSFSFADASYEDCRANIEDIAPQWCILIDSMKAMYDWRVLVNLLKDEPYISYAKVAQYEAHKHNLKELKRFVLKYGGKPLYKEIFCDLTQTSNYCNYIGHGTINRKKVTVSKCKDKEVFYTYLKQKLEGIKNNVPEENALEYEFLMEGVMNESLLPLQHSKENAVLPQQLHYAELSMILENAIKHHEFLTKKDTDGFTEAEKIISIFQHKIPYYVGPLGSKHKDEGANCWAVRKEEGRIYPWNFEDKVDLEASNEAFIRRMTNKCTYLIGEDVLPKNSLLYTKYMVLNELNNLKIKGNKPSVELKQQIFEDLFKTYSRVTEKKLIAYLKSLGFDVEKEDLAGFDQNFNSSLTSYLDFKKHVYGDRIDEPEVQMIIENIIKWATIYGDDKKLLESMIKRNYPHRFTGKQLKAILRFNYSGWGRLSRKYLTGIEGTYKETGEIMTIMEGLWSTNHNLMQLLSSDYTFTEVINNYNKKLTSEITSISYDSLVKELYTSPSNKRAIWQAIKIAEEIRKIMGVAPAKIFIKMYRGGTEDQKGKRTTSRKQRLLDLYKGCDKATREWAKEHIEKHDEREFNSEKLFLYYLQQGKCMYTGNAIDLEALMSNNYGWNKDHIYPKSLFDDESLDNIVLVDKEINRNKDTALIPAEIQKKMTPYWKMLLETGFISKKKYERLTRTTPFSDEELASFISNNIEENSQSTKIAAEILNRIYSSYGTKIKYVKAGLVSKFRQQDLYLLKSKRVNDYHYAEEAFLNIVVGNVYDIKFTSNPLRWVRENRSELHSINAVFKFDVFKGERMIWEGLHKGNAGTIARIRDTISNTPVQFTQHTFCETGALFDATLYSPSTSIKVALKQNLSIEKYGGYKSVNTSYFAFIEYDGKKGERIRTFMGVPIMVANTIGQAPNVLKEYYESKGFNNVKIIKDKIKKNSLLIIDGYPLRIRGENEARVYMKSNVQLKLDKNEYETVRRIEKYLSKGYQEVDVKIDKLDDEGMTNLYDAIIDKLENSIYKKRPNNPCEKLQAGRKKFERLSLHDKAKVLNEIMTIVRCDNSTIADLSLIGAAKSSASISKGKGNVGQSKIVLVHQSVTGLLENRESL